MSLYAKQPSQRQLVVASAIRQVISSAIISKEIFHPVLDDLVLVFPFAKITSDLKIATVYVDCLDKERLQDVMLILKLFNSQLRKLITQKIKLKYSPEIRFQIDDMTNSQLSVYKVLDSISD